MWQMKNEVIPVVNGVHDTINKKTARKYHRELQ